MNEKLIQTTPITAKHWPEAPFKYKWLAFIARILYFGFKMEIGIKKLSTQQAQNTMGPIEYSIWIYRNGCRDWGANSMAFDLETVYEGIFERIFSWSNWWWYIIRREDIKNRNNYVRNHRI